MIKRIGTIVTTVLLFAAVFFGPRIAWPRSAGESVNVLHIQRENPPAAHISEAVTILGWKTYRDPRYDFLIQYPPRYHVTRKTTNASIAGFDEQIDFSQNARVILRIVITNLATSFNPNMTADAYFAFVRKASRSSKMITINGQQAIESVQCGRAACSWSVSVVHGGKLFEISSFVNENAEEPTDTAKYPLKTMVYSFKFATK